MMFIAWQSISESTARGEMSFISLRVEFKTTLEAINIPPLRGGLSHF